MSTIKKTVLNIFDFDGTLVNTQVPETGKTIWEEKTGNKWPHVGWWGRAESLDNDIFEQPVIETTVLEYKRLYSLDNSHTIMLTGRRKKLSKEVENILITNNLVFDEYRYNYGGDTISNKIEQIGDMLGYLKDVIEINIFEDRIEHIGIFKQFFEGLCERGRLNSFTIYQVNEDGSHTLLPIAPCKMCNGSGSVVEIELEKQCCHQPSQYGGCCGNAVPAQVEVEYPCPKCEGKYVFPGNVTVRK